MAPPVNISELALKNEANITASLAAIKVTAEIKAFDQHLKDKLKSSINLSQKAFAGCLTDGKYLSTYEFFGIANTGALKAHFSSKYPFRKSFDGLFVDGHKMKYFALNSGNMGMPGLWGRYCMVFKLNYFDPNKSAVLRKNSLAKQTLHTHYYFKGQNPDLYRIGTEISNTGLAREQCVIKKHPATAGYPQKQYPDLVCNSKVKSKSFKDADYLELLTTQDCLLNRKDYAVRLTKQEFSLFYKAIFDSVDGNALKDKKLALTRELKEFLTLYKKHNFAVESTEI